MSTREMDLFKNQDSKFPTAYNEILQRVRRIDPIEYSSTRNYINGSVTHLSPYISRGVVSTKMILAEVLERGYKPAAIEKFIQELAWRDYWQQVWIAKNDAISEDLINKQKPVSNYAIPKSITEASTGIEAIDRAIKEFYKTGYLHNHVRMYIAAIACNIGQSHWKVLAQWMYYHLLDADWASNALSWQWVAGANASKKYFANQENINKYCFSQQRDTFLDVPYEAFDGMFVPDVLKETASITLKTTFPPQKALKIDESLPVIIYNFYNLDPIWKRKIAANRILLLEPSHFQEYPVSENTIHFLIRLADENLDDIQIYCGEFHDLIRAYKFNEIYFKEHPLNKHYQGTEEPRDWMFDVQGYYPSFFAFWKKCKKQFGI